MPGNLLIVAGHYFNGDTELGEGGQCLTGPRLRRIEEGQKTGKGQLGFIGDIRMLAVHFDLPPRDA